MGSNRVGQIDHERLFRYILTMIILIFLKYVKTA